MKRLILYILVFCAGTSMSAAAWASIVMPWYVIDGGGGGQSGPDHRLVSSVGQPGIASLSGAGWLHEVGYWAVASVLTVEVPGFPTRGPSAFALHRPSPNPVRVGGSIGYEVPVRGVVTLRLYDVAGKRVATLVEGEVQPGLHRVGVPDLALPAGVYFIRMQAAGFESKQKLVILR